MFKEVIKQSFIYFSLGLCGLLSSCSSGNNEAAKLLAESQAMMEHGNYDTVLLLLDSIDSAYPEVVDIRRKAMELRPRAIEQITIRELSLTDSLLAVQTIYGDSLSDRLIRIDNPLEPYFVAKSEQRVVPSATAGLHSRVAPDGMFYMIATTLNPVKTTSITLSSGNECASTNKIAIDGERNIHTVSHDALTLISAECDTLARFIVNHVGDPITLTFNGNGSYVMSLPDSQIRSVIDTYKTAQALTECKRLQINKNRLERQLAVARSQIARTLSE